MPNNAIGENPPTGSVENLTTHGSDWLWAVFAFMTFSDIVVFFWQFALPRGQRVFHQLSLLILTTAAIAYFSMASDLGFTPIATEFNHYTAAGVPRQIWYVRYIDWVITTPSLLLTLVLGTGLPLSDIITLCYFDIVMIVTGLVGSLVVSVYKWGFFAFGCAALFYIWWVLAGPARTSAGQLGPGFKKTFTHSAIILSFLWLLYPIAWGLADGGNVISTDSEMIFYGVLDVLAKPVFCFIHIGLLSREDLTLLQLSSGKFSTGVGAYDREKNAVGAVPAAAFPNASPTGTAAPVGVKKGLFGRRGHYDAAPANAVATHTTTAAPRASEATAVSS